MQIPPIAHMPYRQPSDRPVNRAMSGPISELMRLMKP